jgi:N-methylhydantoinase A
MHYSVFVIEHIKHNSSAFGGLGEILLKARIAVDVGGTFTDCVTVNSEGDLTISKTITMATHSDGVIEAVRKTGTPLDETEIFILGTTIGTNALISRKAAPPGLIATKGFGDVLEIQRGDRTRLYDLNFEKNHPLVPREKVVEVDERIDASGQVVIPLTQEKISHAVAKLVDKGVQSIAVCLLFSYLNPIHERMIKDFVQENYPELDITISSDLAPEWKEFERTSTVAVNAYLLPIMNQYLQQVHVALKKAGFQRDYFVMQSNGGVSTSDRIRECPVNTLLSGPVGGVQGASYYGRLVGVKDFRSLDMGGTSTDVCLVENGQPVVEAETQLEHGIPLKVRSVAIQALGSGGGSIAHAEAGRLLVGPQSAGSNPGPACYNRGGTEPTITDAALILGYLSPEFSLAGEISLHKALAEKAIEEKIAKKLGISLIEAANGIIQIGLDRVANGCRLVSVAQGKDPRMLSLFAFGGAAPMYACQIAEQIGIDTIIIPRHPGVSSALGLIVAPLRSDLRKTKVLRAIDANVDDINSQFYALDNQLIGILESEGLKRDQLKIRRYLGARYVQQTHEIDIPCDEEVTGKNLNSIIQRFHKRHEELYTFSMPDRSVEFISYTMSAIAEFEPLHLKVKTTTTKKTPVEARQVYFPRTGWCEAQVLLREEIEAGCMINGPACIHQLDSTVVVKPGYSATTDDYGCLKITRGDR